MFIDKDGVASPAHAPRHNEAQIECPGDPIQYDFPAAPLAFDAERQLQWMLWFVLPPGVEEGTSTDNAYQPLSHFNHEQHP